MVKSPLHDSTVGLIRNLWTHKISPLFHVVYDDAFETVHSGDGAPPDLRPDLFIFNRFKSDYDESNAKQPEEEKKDLKPYRLSFNLKRKPHLLESVSRTTALTM